MPLPELLLLDSSVDYRRHYQQHYCRGEIITFDGIRVYFKPQKFDHAFYKNSQNRRGPKDEFCTVRAQRMDWIKLTLEHPEADLFEGWNSKNGTYDGTRRVSVVYGDFVVIIEMSLSKKGVLKANFVTCYEADNSIGKIRQSPQWDRDKCLIDLEK